MIKKHLKKALTLFLFLAGLTVFSASEHMAAAEKDTEPETIDFRILTTSDLHGQVTAWNYETGERDETVGLSKIYTLIQKERKAVGKNNTLLIDAGDCLYNYSTNYIYENYPEDLQPIYYAMSVMHYDAITLGNHDFDYPWEYLYSQLEQSGLLAKTFASNAVYTESGAPPFRTSAIYTRKAKTSSGRTVRIKIGVVGATKASFSTRRYRYGGFLDGLDIYQSVKDEAAKLKEQGADFVVAFIHGGLGLLSGSDPAVQAGARLARLSDIDAVVCSHSHETFPSLNNTYSTFPHVNETKGLIYDTPVVQGGSHASALGVISFKLKVSSTNKISILESSAKVKQVTASTKEDSTIVDLYADYHDELLASHAPTEYQITDGQVYTNADAIVADSDLYQLMNEAKLRYAASYVADYVPEYNDYPIVSATVNYLDNKKRTIALSGTITESDIAALLNESSSERSSGYVHIYKLSGENLLEWLEYTASIYGTIGTSLPSLLDSYAADNPSVSSLARSYALKDWSSFFVFDGVSYDIDISVAPRYNANGNLINYTKRIVNPTIQGQPITPDMEILVVMDSLAVRYKFMPTTEDSILTTLLWTTSKDVLIDYIRNQTSMGPLNVKADNNWRLTVPSDYRFVVAVPKEHHKYITAQSWYQKRIFRGSHYYYYLGKIKSEPQMPSVVLSPGIIDETSRPVPIRILVNPVPGTTVEEVLYLGGNISSIDDPLWDSQGMNASDFSIRVRKNGPYSIRVTDSAGNQIIGRINITNYNRDALEPPRISTLTNRISSATGTAIPYSIVHIALPDGRILQQQCDKTGTFQIELPLPRSYEMYSAWTTRGTKTSEVVELSVKKTGANRPEADPLLAGSANVTGTADPYVTLSLRLGSTVYVGIGETDAYKASSVYKTTHNIVETHISYRSDGTFSIELPTAAKAGKVYYLYATDRNGNASRIVNIFVE